MSNITRADIEAMRAAASRIAGSAERFRDEYTAMYGVIHNDLTRAWVGADSDSFVANVDSVTYRFEHMYDIMMSYADFIRSSADSYEEQIAAMEAAAQDLDYES